MDADCPVCQAPLQNPSEPLSCCKKVLSNQLQAANAQASQSPSASNVSRFNPPATNAAVPPPVQATTRPPRPVPRARLYAYNGVAPAAPNPFIIRSNISPQPSVQTDDSDDIYIPRTYNCPYCPVGGLDDLELRDHCNNNHLNDRRQVVCPVCVSLPHGNPTYYSQDFMGHINLRHSYYIDNITNAQQSDYVNMQEAIMSTNIDQTSYRCSFLITDHCGHSMVHKHMQTLQTHTAHRPAVQCSMAEIQLIVTFTCGQQGEGKNSILGEEYRWPTTVPYYLEDSLEINAKGVVLKAFEQYRLKTCIDFKPWSGETNYISVFKGSGCFSSVGNRHVGKQRLSIGNNCDRLATVEHEFLHALGFWHEQSRADRDDYVNIMWDQIEAGKEHNFNTYDDTVSSALGFPYDYTSVMHYSKTSFNKDTKPTIVTRIPEFMDIIGQRMEFSSSDVRKLNRLYNCSTSSTFIDSCSFEQPNICGMIQRTDAKAKWVRVKSAEEGANTDHTTMGQCNGLGYIMHFSTATGNPGDNAYLESRLFYPKRGRQCLQFYMYNSGDDDDQLNIWVQEYTNEFPNGMLRLLQTIKGGQKDSWALHHVTLDASQKFRVVFEGVKGKGVSEGGLSLDDINLSETQCPHHVWHIQNFTSLLATTPAGKKIYSPTFSSPDGYFFQISLYVNGKSSSSSSMAIYFHLTSGPNDSRLKWPCPWRQATIALMDQHPNIQQRMDNQRMITTDPSKTSTDSQGNVEYFWDDPQKVGSLVKNPDGTTYYRGPGTGTSSFITHSRLKSRDFIKGNDVIFLLSLEDVTGLLETQPVPQPAAHVNTEGKSATSIVNSTAAVFFGFVAVLTLLLAVASVVYGVKRPRTSEATDTERGAVPK
ncbi:Meprin A subunit beta [Bagarius yarrelli]|uniref:Metalloendopeptidase n=1 Tax=Bagarius yarrelli TaxID=175774 RepID=A0A556TSU9_BAGYA|nr:Meprin A subunit beta [Bagarius yarrelli]